MNIFISMDFIIDMNMFISVDFIDIHIDINILLSMDIHGNRYP